MPHNVDKQKIQVYSVQKKHKIVHEWWFIIDTLFIPKARGEEGVDERGTGVSTLLVWEDPMNSHFFFSKITNFLQIGDKEMLLQQNDHCPAVTLV